MKKWTAKQTQIEGNITAEDFNEEYAQFINNKTAQEELF